MISDQHTQPDFASPAGGQPDVGSTPAAAGPHAPQRGKGRLMSFALTTAQILDRSKTVTRRLGWKKLKAGDRLQAVRKAMGLKPGEKPEVLAIIEVVHVREERLDDITPRDVVAEGFPDLTPAEFVRMFCQHMAVDGDEVVRRIKFKYVDAAA